jgi:hypothetical protein
MAVTPFESYTERMNHTQLNEVSSFEAEIDSGLNFDEVEQGKISIRLSRQPSNIAVIYALAFRYREAGWPNFTYDHQFNQVILEYPEID